MVDKNLAKACPQEALFPSLGSAFAFYSHHQTAPSEALRRNSPRRAQVECITCDLTDTMRAVGPGENGGVLGWIGVAEGGGTPRKLPLGGLNF